MKTIPTALATHLAQEVTTLAVCWAVTRTDGLVIRGSHHDRAIIIASGDHAGTYPPAGGMAASAIRSNSDLAVDNLNVDGPLQRDGLTIVNLRAVDIEAGLFDGASFVMFVVNWAAPNDGQIVVRSGTLGESRYTAEGRYQTELRGLSQALSQNVVRTYGVLCDAELGDTRCKVNTAILAASGTVTAVTSRRRFAATLAGLPTLGAYTGGKLTFTSGANDGYSREVRRDTTAGAFDFDLFEPFPADIEIGDTFSVIPGCAKTREACKGFGNFVNFRGHGLLVPGTTEILKVGGQ